MKMSPKTETKKREKKEEKSGEDKSKTCSQAQNQNPILSFQLDTQTIRVTQQLISILWKEKKTQNENEQENPDANSNGGESESEDSDSSSDSATELSDGDSSVHSSMSVLSGSRSMTSIEEKGLEKRRKIPGISIIHALEFAACVLYTFQMLILLSAGARFGEGVCGALTLVLLWASCSTTREIQLQTDSLIMRYRLEIKLFLLAVQIVFMIISIILAASLPFAFLQIGFLVFYISIYGILGGFLALCRYTENKNKVKVKGQGHFVTVKFSLDLQELNTPPKLQEKEEAGSEDDEVTGENSV